MNLLFRILIIFSCVTFVGCENEGLQDVLEVYELESRLRGDTLTIYDLKVLETHFVDQKEYQSIRNNSNEEIIKLRKERIELVEKSIQLINEKIANYKKLIEIDKAENIVSHQKEIDICKEELSKRKKEVSQDLFEISRLEKQIKESLSSSISNDSLLFKFYEFKIEASVNGFEFKDTLGIILNKIGRYKFIKNQKFVDYQGQ